MFDRVKKLLREIKWRLGFTPICPVCGERRGVYYFGEIEIPKGEGEHVKVGETTLDGTLDSPIDVVKWTGDKEEISYFECEECYKE